MAKNKHMRLPNGFGQISEIKGRNLRNPWRAMITVGKTPEGRPICQVLKPKGYFATYNEAYAALMKYNENPYDLNDVMTVGELYEKWIEIYFQKITPSATRSITSAWSYCGSVANIMARDLRGRHIKACIEGCDKPSIKNRIKSMFNLMLDYAVEYEIVEKNYARDFKVEKAENITEHKAFTDEEMSILWSATSIPLVNIILIQCYMGWRPQELCKLRLENITDEWITGGMKTDAGRDRQVPIWSGIAELVKRIKTVSELRGSEYLVCDQDGNPLSYDRYYKMFMALMEELNITGHRPHDCRKQFITMCKRYGVDEYAIKYMAGHSITDLTERVYTERDSEWLKEEIEKIKGAN